MTPRRFRIEVGSRSHNIRKAEVVAVEPQDAVTEYHRHLPEGPEVADRVVDLGPVPPWWTPGVIVRVYRYA